MGRQFGEQGDQFGLVLIRPSTAAIAAS